MENTTNNDDIDPISTDPILRTANMVKAMHWYCGEDQEGSTHCTGKVLEWVGRTPLDDSPENLEAREELSLWMLQLAFKVARPPFDDLDSAIRLVECALPIRIAADKTEFLEQVRQQLYRAQANPIIATSLKVKSFLDADYNNPKQDADQVLEWVRQTPLDDSPELLEAREMLAGRISDLALNLAGPPYHDPVTALRLMDCALTLHVSTNMHERLEEIQQQMLAAD